MSETRHPGAKGARPTGPRPPKRVSAAYLERAALYYLERFAATSAGLRRVLMRKVAASAKAHDTDPAQGAAWVDDLIARYERAGLLDDQRFAQARAATLQRRGGSTRAIRQKLAAKGVAAPLIEAALDDLAQDLSGDPDQDGGQGDGRQGIDDAAAHAYARRRRLGPHRPPETRAAKRDRDIAAMARAGFSLTLARRVIDAGAPGDNDEDGPYEDAPDETGWPD